MSVVSAAKKVRSIIKDPRTARWENRDGACYTVIKTEIEMGNGVLNAISEGCAFLLNEYGYEVDYHIHASERAFVLHFSFE